MKSWFVYLINGKMIGAWANNNDEAEKNLQAEYGCVQMEFVGIKTGKIGPQPEIYIRNGMTPLDSVIASGFLNMLIRGLY